MVTADNSTFAEDIAPDVLVLSRPDGFADVVLASAVLEPARKALPRAKIFLLIREKYAGIFCNHPALDGLIFLDEAAGLRALAKNERIPGAFRGTPAAFCYVSILALAFTGLSGGGMGV